MATRSLPSRLRTAVRVSPGCIFVSVGALDALRFAGIPLVYFLIRHMCGDWGRLTDEDWQRNERALMTGHYLLSSYKLSNGQKIWMHATCERSATFVLLPTGSSRWSQSLRDELLGR